MAALVGPVGVEPSLSVQLVAAVVAGTALGSCTGLVPGLHANTVALALAGAAPALPVAPGTVAAAMLAVGVAHTVLNAVPALAIGVPDAETAVAALPGHRLVRAGRGREAIRLSVLGSAAAVALAVPLAAPLGLAAARWYPVVADNVAAILAAVVVGMLAAERTPRSRLVAAATFLLAAALGWLTLDLDPAAPLSAVGVLALLPGGVDDRGYVVATSAVDSSNAVFALFALATIDRPRSGVVVAVDELGAPLDLPVLVASALAAGALAALVALAVGDRYVAAVGDLDHATVATATLGLLVVLAGLLAGLPGIGIFAVATLVGLVPVLGGAYRVHCMGVLIGPLLVWA